jgi:hypothetical protein
MSLSWDSSCGRPVPNQGSAALTQSATLPLGFPSPKSKVRTSLTLSGFVISLVMLSVSLSAFERFRIPVGGLMVHAYLVALAPLGLFVLLYRLGDFPRGILVCLLLFTTLYCFSTLGYAGAPQESVKMIAGTATIIVTALMIRSEADFRLATTALLWAIALLALYGLFNKQGSYVGADPMQGTNENAFSLYSLPPLLLAGTLLFEKKGRKYWIWLLPGIMMIVVATFSSGNRAAWLGVVMILLMQLCRPKTIRIIPFVILLGAAGYFAVSFFGDKEIVRVRYEESLHKNKSDDLRLQLFLTAFKIGFENPILGVAPQYVHFQLAREIHYKTGIDAHNVFGYIVAGCGLLIFALFMFLGYLLWRRPESERRSGLSSFLILSGSPHFRMLRMMLVMWIMRGSFSREILYSPGFCIGLGLVIGLCIVHGMWKPVPASRRIPSLAGPALATR